MPQKRTLSQLIAQGILRTINWKLNVILPTEKKYVLIGAPHTSNWDFPFALLLKYAAGLKMHWIGKDSLFQPPFGFIMRRLGGIPVNRQSKNNFVAQMVEVYNQCEELVVAISPEGTRSKVDYWKTGFYYIALGAGIPIAMGFVDYTHRILGIGPSLIPTADLQADFIQIQDFYSNIGGKHPRLQGEVKLREEFPELTPQK